MSLFDLDSSAATPGWHATGDGRAGTVLALHSLGLDLRSFQPLRSCLSSDWRFIAMDLPGHGQAALPPSWQWPAVVDAVCSRIDSAGLDRLHLVGHSMGGAVAAQVAERLGNRVHSLTLIATPAQGMPAFAQRGSAAQHEGMPAVAASTLQRWFGERARAAGDPCVAYAGECLLHMDVAAFAGAWQALAQFPGYAAIASHLPPALLLSARDDASTPPQVMASIFQTLASTNPAGVRHHTIADAGHMLVLTHAAQIAAQVLDHWRQCTGATPSLSKETQP